MVLQLHVWGPAFSLPSIDVQCLASIAYVSQAVPRNGWILVASNDPAASPIRDLPVLHDGTRRIGGFQNIVDYLRTRSIHLEANNYGVREKADVIAFSSFVECQGQPLLDLSLYVSSENYHSSTRPAYAKILKWPQQWFLPSQRRTAAKARTEHLDVFSQDLDSNGRESRTRTPGSDLLPKPLRASRQTLSALIQQTQQTSRFRMEALAEAFLEPLEQLLGDKSYMISGPGPSSLDCLAFAYLALALVPDVPQPWLAETMKARYPTLCTYVENLTQDFFGGPVYVGDAYPDLVFEVSHAHHGKGEKVIYPLPWKASQQSGLKSAASALLEVTLGSVRLDDPRIVQQESSAPRAYQDEGQSSKTAGSSLRLSAVAIATGLSYVGILIYSGVISFPGSSESKPRSLSDMGEAGAILSFVDSARPEPRKNDTVPVAEVAVTVEEGANL